MQLRRRLLVMSLLLLAALQAAPPADGARRVVRRGPRGRVVVHTAFPLRRPLPRVVVRAPLAPVRVAPRVFLPGVAFGAAAFAANAGVATWQDSEKLEGEDDWTEFTMNVDQRGRKLLLDIDEGPAQISFAEVVFENGDAQVVDFDDRVHKQGTYLLLDFKDGRKVDHARLVAKATKDSSKLSLHLVE